MSETFSSLHVSRALGIPFATLRDWYRREFITATTPAAGPSIRAKFTREDCYAIAFFQDLLRRGFRRDAASQLARILRKKCQDRTVDYALFLMQGEEVRCVTFEGTKNNTGELSVDVNLNKGEVTLHTAMGSALPKSFDWPGRLGPEWEMILAMHVSLTTTKVDSALGGAAG